MRTIAVLPVKSFPVAKQRLREDLDPGRREDLVEAMLLDVLSGLCATSVDAVLVVTGSPTAARIAAEHGANVVEDSETGHNDAAALGIAAALAAGAQRALLVPGDCPTLDPHEVDDLLSHPAGYPSVLVVPDRHGTGTNALLLTPPDALRTSFGPGSCRRHVAAAEARGLAAEVVDVPSLAFDVDTPDDLAALASQADRAVRTRRLLTAC